jgi:hypothetical protein
MRRGGLGIPAEPGRKYPIGTLRLHPKGCSVCRPVDTSAPCQITLLDPRWFDILVMDDCLFTVQTVLKDFEDIEVCIVF